ncbi:hypothetical protein SAMN04487989_10683 [Bizionia echini]|uniref:Uncharacterized protein n=1 Tax=Bizionia echini TaxID=649333 RepID=A0A1I5CY25_9FLAO|nr:hypothetical protein [Bizionia echini]SFN91859.1 hypothetical protein SAMN04487989_10683 [Bizionia echini]
MKNLQNLGTVLNKAEQRKINGGGGRKPFMCSGFPVVVACPVKSMCNEYAPGQWDCNG